MGEALVIQTWPESMKPATLALYLDMSSSSFYRFLGANKDFPPAHPKTGGRLKSDVDNWLRIHNSFTVQKSGSDWIVGERGNV